MSPLGSSLSIARSGFKSSAKALSIASSSSSMVVGHFQILIPRSRTTRLKWLASEKSAALRPCFLARPNCSPSSPRSSSPCLLSCPRGTHPNSPLKWLQSMACVLTARNRFATWSKRRTLALRGSALRSARSASLSRSKSRWLGGDGDDASKSTTDGGAIKRSLCEASDESSDSSSGAPMEIIDAMLPLLSLLLLKLLFLSRS
mmetsp:Transcript_14805/g.30433  ORF Transcript_14805/g.30433 Transcript_14805/m.30433 type:complete len:203 (-) Transcript_14805:910-1518(-)